MPAARVQPMKLTLIPTSNATKTGEFSNLPADHWIVGAGVSSSDTVPEGRHYAVIEVALAGASPPRYFTIWSGKVRIGSLFSVPNLPLTGLEKVRMQVWSASNVGSEEIVGYVLVGNAPAGGASIFHESPRAGPGQVREITSADPAANAEVAAQAVGSNAWWKLRSYGVTMAQGVTQTPHPALHIRGSLGQTLARIPIGADVAASTTVRCTWTEDGTDTRNNVTNGEMHASLPGDLWLPPLADVLTSTEGLGAASNYGVAELEIEEWASPEVPVT